MIKNSIVWWLQAQKSIYSYISLSFSQKKAIFKFLSKNLQEDTALYILVSWWADSMLTTHLILDYFFTQWRDTSNVYMLHYNHKQRSSADDEALFLQRYFSSFHVLVGTYEVQNHYGTEKHDTENTLRKERKAWIAKQLYNAPWSFYVCTWHNLTDRIETSYLHMARGASLHWLLNMSMVDKSIYDVWTENISMISQKFILPSYTLCALPTLRPLLTCTKKEITHICHKNNIPYMYDYTNNDIHVSKRNYIRKQLYREQKQTPCDFLGVRKKLYIYASRKKREVYKAWIILCPLRASIYRSLPSGAFYKTRIPKTCRQTFSLFLCLSCVSWVSNATIEEFTSFFIHSTSWWKYIQWRYMYICHGWLYVLYRPKKNILPQDITFSQTQPITNLCSYITWSGEYLFWDFIWKISCDRYTWCIIRFPVSWDRYGSSLLSRYIKKKSIPVFRRKYIPILVDKEQTVQAILPYKYLTCHM